jgi:hypothetical protein
MIMIENNTHFFFFKFGDVNKFSVQIVPRHDWRK